VLPNHKPEKYLRLYVSVQVKRNTVKRKQAAIGVFRAEICGHSRCVWAQQIIYHTRFYTDDVYHHVILIIQFMLFGEARTVVLSSSSFVDIDCWIVG